MATFTKTLSGDSRYSIKLTVTEKTITSDDMANNRSRVDYTLTATKSSGSGYYTSNTTNSVRITLGGIEVENKKVAYDFTGSTPKTITLASGTVPIEHEPDGSKTISCKGYFKDAENSLGNATASGNLTLTQLHKAPSINYATYSINKPTGFTSKDVIDYMTFCTFTPNITTYDGATLTSTSLSYCGINGTQYGNGFYVNLLDITPENHTRIITATDSMGATTTYSYIPFTYLPYVKPAINKLTAKRVGQLSGDIKIVANGTYFTSEDLSQPIVPLVKYSIKQGETTIVNETTASSLTYSGGTWSIEEDLTGVCDYRYSYEVIITITDNLITARNSNLPTIAGTPVEPVSIPSASTVIPLGEPTWTEYKDRVDFKRITRQKGEVYGEFVLYDNATGTTGNITLTNDSFANYDYIEIFYFDASNDGKRSEKVYSPNNSTISLNMIYDNGAYCYFYAKSYSISGATMTAGTEVRWRIATSGNATRGTTTKNTTIYRVVGYK